VGLSQQELADKSGLSARTIGNLERGSAKWPHPSSVLRLADALGLSGPERDEFTATPGRRLARQAVAQQVHDPATDVGVAAGYRHGLPLDTAAFTGRDAELELIAHGVTADAAMTDPGGAVAIKVIDGMPGVGKTALAVHAAHLLTAAFPDRQLFIDLHGHTPGREPVSPEDALAWLLTATGADPRFLPADLAGRAVLWLDRMAGQRALLVLDNAASSAQVAPLLPGSGGCLVLVTSRRHLADLPGAVVPVPVDTLPPGQARTMFARLAPRAAGEDQAHIGDLAELAGHLPLAVSLLARVHARHPAWTLADLIAETRGSLLTLAAEHVSVAAAFDVSWRHLDPGPQRFLAQLGLHPGTSIDRHAAAALSGVQAAEAGRLLDELHREGLLTETGYRRYHMHDLIRRYAATRADEVMTTGEQEEAFGRLFGYYTRAAARVDSQLPDLAGTGEALAWARTERANLLACLDHAGAAGWHSRVVKLTAALAGFLQHDGPWNQAIALHATAAVAARSLGDRPGLAHALLDLGTVRRLAGDYEDAAGALAESLRIHQDTADGPGQARVLQELAHVQLLSDDYQAAAAGAQQALEICRGTGDKSGQAKALIMLGSSRRLSDDTGAAIKALTRALRICRDLGDRAGQAHALRQLGDVRRLTGDLHAAAGYLEQSLGLSRSIDDRHGQANALTWLGGVRRLTGDYPGAAADLERALDIQRELSNRLGQANALTLLGDLRRETGDFQPAARDLEQALRLYRELGARAGQAQVLSWLGALRRLTGDYEASARDLAEALSLSREMGDRGGETTGLNQLGELHRARGDVGRARDCHLRALDLARELQGSWDEAHALAGLGRCAHASGDLAAATRLLGQAHDIFCRIGAAEAAGLADELDAMSKNDLRPEC
jgi:tetratricopeptide (TPR) repeat protein/transcriptional regulator with XRE-family HTH domain